MDAACARLLALPTPRSGGRARWVQVVSRVIQVTACSPSDFHKRRAVLQALHSIAPYAATMPQIDEVRRPAVRTAYGSEANAPKTQTWQIRRAFVRARRALLNLRQREVAKAILQIESLLATSATAPRYEDALTQLRACLLVVEDDLPRARELLISTRAAAEGTLPKTLLRYIDWLIGERAELAEQATQHDAGTSTRCSTLVRILNLCLNAALEFEQLRPTVAANLAAEALRLATERYGTASSASSLPAVLLAQIAYEQGRLTEAEFLIRARLATIRTIGVLECVARASIVLARLALHQGRTAEAFEVLRDAETIGRIRGWPRLAHAAKAEHARILVTVRRKTHEADSAQHAPESSAVSLIGRSDPDVTPRYSSLEAALTHLISTSPHVHTEDRYRILVACLRIGATHGLYRLFVDAGAPLLPLLRNLSRWPRLLGEQSFDLSPYISLLLRAAAPGTTRSSDSATKRRQPLSRRETAILRMIAQGMSNKQIAQALGITPETVKSHAKNILLKLGTRTRAQAVARATSMELS
jgi:LuxR family transcriptional regulator, maltose regulon positive regulatory protein